MNKITVVIPNYNGIHYIEGCLEALYAQEADTPAFEILMVDNASADGGLEAAQHFVQKQLDAGGSPCVSTRFITLSRNTGFCHAVNVGIRNSSAPYVILLNNDTKVGKRFVKSLWEAIEADPRIFSVSAKMLMWDRPELVDDAGDIYNVLGWAYARGKGKRAERYNRPVRVFSACGGAAIYRRSILEQIGLFDERHFAYLEDLDLGYRARIHGYINRYEPQAEVLHFGSASTGSRYNAFKTKRAAANSVYVLYKNMPPLQLLWNLPFLTAGFCIKWLFFCKKRMGGLYLQGLAAGVGLCMSEKGRTHRVRFAPQHMGNYLRIQLELYGNLCKQLLG